MSEKRGFIPVDKTKKDKGDGKSYFLGIGIDKYQKFDSLNNAVSDVTALAELLKKEYDIDETIIIKNEKATREHIIDQLDKLKKKVSPNDKLLIFFSGHGHLDDDEKGFWIPTDADKSNTAHYIRNSTIRDYIEDFKSLHTLLISDSCFSGSLIVRGATRSSSAVEDLEKKKSRWVLCSGGHDQLVYDGSPGKNSPFTSSVIETLKNSKDAKINVGKLTELVRELTRANYKQLPEGYPLFGVGHKGGQYVFCRKLFEEEDWKSCQIENTLSAYRSFTKKYPKSKYHNEALKQIAEMQAEESWEKTRKKDKIRDYYQFIRKYPNSKYKQDAVLFIRNLEEEKTWKGCLKKDIISAYLSYKDTFPTGKYVHEAETRIDELLDIEESSEKLLEEKKTWENAQKENTLAAFSSFLKAFPGSVYLEEAERQITRLKEELKKKELLDLDEAAWLQAKKKHAIRAYQNYLKKFPMGSFGKSAKAQITLLRNANAKSRKAKAAKVEKADWENACRRNLIKEFQAFQKAYPESKYLAESERRIKKIREERRKARKVASNTSPNQLYQLGLEYWQGIGRRKNISKALELFEKAALKGLADAQNQLGLLYDAGNGVKQDYKVAVKWYRKAAEQGYDWGQYNLAIKYYNGEGVAQHYREAVKWYRKAAEQGNTDAQNQLGLLYYAGNGVKQNYTEAAKWFKKAAEQGHVSGQYNLGFSYYNGEGVAQDNREAVKWYRKAAEQGNADAQNRLGVLYDTGNGVQQDYKAAVQWYRKAAEQGHASGQYNLGVNHQYGRGLRQNYAEAAKWYRKAAEQGDSDAQNQLGLLYDTGKGVKQDYKAAVRWYRKAAEQSHASGQYNLGVSYYNGEGVEQNYREAAKWCRKAAEQGHAKAQNHLGVSYHEGKGLPKNEKEAVYWFQKAAEQGDTDAKAWLENINEGFWGQLKSFWDDL